MLCDRLKKDIGKDPVISRERRQEKERTSKEETSIDGEVDPCLLLAESHYVVSGSIGVRAQVQIPMPIVIDTGSGYNVIRRIALPEGWKKCITTSQGIPSLGDANGNALDIRQQVLLRVRFGNAL